MLTYIKDKIKGWVAWVIVIIIVIPFALFGIGQYLNTPSDIVIASVDGEDILRSEYLNLYEQRKSLYQKDLGDSYNEKIDRTIKKNTIQEVLRNRILTKYAKDNHIATTDQELKNNILSLKDFKDESGQFSLERYKTVLRLTGLSEPGFEIKQRKLLVRTQFLDSILESDFILPTRNKLVINLLSEERKFSYVSVPISQFLDKVKPTEKDIRVFYDANVKEFIQARMAKVSYLTLSKENLNESIQIPENELKVLYEEEKNNLKSDEQRRAKHILISDKKLAEKVFLMLKKGALFDDLAKQYSEDTGSKNEGGDLGFFSKGIMVSEFEQSAFSLNKGEQSELIKSEFGYHIIVLTDIKEEKVPSFEEIRKKLVNQYKENKISELLYKTSEDLANAAYGDVTLTEVAREFNLIIKTTNLFSENSIGKEKILTQEFIKNSFSKEVYEKSENSNIFEPDEGFFVILRLIEKTPKRQQEFKEVEEKIVTLLKQKLAQNISFEITNKLKELLDKKQNNKVDNFMKEYSLKWEKVGWIDRGNKTIADGALTNIVFSMKKPNTGTATILSNKTNNGSILIKLNDIRIQDDIKKLAKEQLDNSRKESIGISIMQMVIEDREYKILENRL